MTAASPVRIAQVGCGYWGKNLLRNFANVGALAAVVDHDAALTAKAAADYGAAVMSFDAVLEDSSIHGIALATPAVTHAPLATRALAAGKHVFVEKPVALEPADAEQLHALATAHGLTLMVGHLLQYHPIFIALRGLIEAGELGELRYIYSNRMSLGKFRTEENVLWSFAPHDISMILALVGGEEPESVTAQGASFVTPGVADWSTLQMRFANGVRAHVQTSWLHPFKEQRLTAIGSKAMAVFEDSKANWDERLALYRHGIDASGAAPVPVAAQAEFVAVEKREPLLDECQHFLDCIRTGTAARTDGAEGLRVLRVLDRAEAAMREQGV
jgi:UDP-2-acetamido-3-amino-2,3-dideoxy-glucuronate N-acetyltransferase